MLVMSRLAGAWLLTLAAILFAGLKQANAADVNASVCDIARHPERYDGRIVSVHGRIDFDFEDFQLSGRGCEPAGIEGIWLEYGRGPKRQPTTWCCGDMTPRDPLRIVENGDFRRFHQYVTAKGSRNGCTEGQCYLYSVSATLTGRIDAVRPETCPNGKGLCCTGGFGHLGMSCARLVIQRVSGVVKVPRTDGR
jgi:hypothetical protein